jgi:predicted GNAT family N-acyltransferase
MRKDEWDILYQLDTEIFDPHDHLTKEFFDKRVNMPGFFAMETNTGNLVGYLVLGQFTDEIAHLGRIGVKKSEQSQGFGSQLIEYAINWFSKQEGVTEVQLFTQVDNHHAQGLYRKSGFKVIGQTWHFFVPFDTLNPTGQFSLHKLQSDEQQVVATLFPQGLPVGAIQRFVKREHALYTLKDDSNNIIGATRFTPSFPGCFPFELLELSAFDDYVLAFKPLCNPPSEVLRVTFHENERLAALCEARGYQLHHKLFRMQLILEK